TMAPHIPGYTFDEVKGKYFKVTPNHLATSAGMYTAAALTRQHEISIVSQIDASASSPLTGNLQRFQQQALRRTRIDKEQIKRSAVVQRSSASAGLMSHERERGAYESQMGDVWRQTWANGLELTPFIQRLLSPGEAQNARDIRHFVLDEASGAVVYATNYDPHPNHQRFGNNLHSISLSPQRIL
ncbi:MAG: hypothetical protein Q9183_006455, partial [Haloplaca sp. 2 TL-2023]